MQNSIDHPTRRARELWDELGQVAKVEAAIKAWHAINTRDPEECQFWKEVFEELDRLEIENNIQH